MERFTPIDNVIIYQYLRLPDFGAVELAVYSYIVGYTQNQAGTDGPYGEPNGKQGYAYTTKARMKTELNLGRDKLDHAINTLVSYGLVETRTQRNRYGGKALLEYKPLTVPSKDEFQRKYGVRGPKG